jgi:hypothetical protein
VRSVSWALVLAAAVALAVELTLSHGSADAFWFAVVGILMVASYIVRARARRATLYRKP